MNPKGASPRRNRYEVATVTTPNPNLLPEKVAQHREVELGKEAKHDPASPSSGRSTEQLISRSVRCPSFISRRLASSAAETRRPLVRRSIGRDLQLADAGLAASAGAHPAPGAGLCGGAPEAGATCQQLGAGAGAAEEGRS